MPSHFVETKISINLLLCFQFLSLIFNDFCYRYSFQSTYHFWEPNIQGKQFLLNLRTLRGQHLAEHENRYASSPPKMSGVGPYRRSNGDKTLFLSREMAHNNFKVGYHLGSLWPSDTYQNNNIYILDHYYTTRPHHVPTEPFKKTTLHSREHWMPSENEHQYGEYEYGGVRAESHFGASTSAPLFREAIIKDPTSSDLPESSKSQWWARNRTRGEQGQGSFFEPPDFNHQTYDYHDKLSDGYSDDQEQHLDWRDDHRLSRTTHLEDFEEGEVNLLFDDVYSRPPETHTFNRSL